MIAAKNSVKDATAVMQQAIGYGALLDVPFCFSCDGQSFVFRDAKVKRYGGRGHELRSVPSHPSPEQHRIVTRVTERHQLSAALRERRVRSSQLQAQLAQALGV